MVLVLKSCGHGFDLSGGLLRNHHRDRPLFSPPQVEVAFWVALAGSI